MDAIGSIGVVRVGSRTVGETAMTTKQLMLLQKLTIFRWQSVLVPISIGKRNVSNNHRPVYEWHELRVFGVLIAMWGAIG